MTRQMYPKSHPWRYAQKCSGCGKTVHRGAWADLCRECKAARDSEAAMRGFKARYHARRRAGLCVRCGQAKGASGVECDVCAETRRVRYGWKRADMRRTGTANAD